MVSKKCEPIDPDNYGRNTYLGGSSCSYNVPVQMINRLLDEDLRRRHCLIQCCSSETDHSYDGNIFMPDVDHLHREVAFGKWAVPKLKKELLCVENDQLVSKALCSLIDFTFNPERSMEIICHNVIARLGNLVSLSSPFIRQKVAILIRYITKAPYGANHISDNKYILKKILQGAKDPVDEVRHEYLRTMYELLRSSLVLQSLTDAGFIDALISQLSSEPNEFCLLHILHSLEHLASMSRQQQEYQIKAGVIETLHYLLESGRSQYGKSILNQSDEESKQSSHELPDQNKPSDEGVDQDALRNEIFARLNLNNIHRSDLKADPNQLSNRTIIGLLGVLAQLMKHSEGKIRFTPDMFQLVVGLLMRNDKNVSNELQVNAIRILTFAAITSENKLLLVHFKQIDEFMEKLTGLIQCDAKLVQMSAIQLLTVISETKYGRGCMKFKLGDIGNAIEMNGDRKDVVEALKVLLKVVQWIP